MSDDWCAYVLRSRTNGRLYTGSTNDLERRLIEVLDVVVRTAVRTNHCLPDCPHAALR
ncbi:MAG: hypothetical protein E6I02_10335 [Chloroflexi bacterium]|nr:MAG: hypothetical protein E6I02_10335 [Chloroflexota bacterium]